jgi:beta-galactosidase GanA
MASSRTVFIDSNNIVVGGKRLNLISGEFHFFRHDKFWWPEIFNAIRDGGFEIISSYVCWQFQEVEKGRYDFRGETTPLRDLDAFLSACQSNNFYLLLRPGPYIASEWKNCGIPDHATQYHKLHPEFLEKARHYIRAVCEVIRPHLFTNGGPIILVQCDNEIDLNVQEYFPSEGYPLSSPQYYRQIFTEAAVEDPGSFPWWLREKYGSIEELNKSYQTSYQRFQGIDLLDKTPTTLAERRRLFDAHEFLEWYSTTYLEKIVAMYRQEGIDVPLYTNVYGRPQPMNYADMQNVVDLIGADFYFSDLISSDELLRMSFSVRHLAATSAIPFITELQSGTAAPWSRDRGVVSPQHHRYMILLAMLCGAKAWNWYMLVNRDEWYCSPINEKGEQRNDFYSHFKDILRVYKDLGWSDFKRNSNISLVWYRPHYWFSRGKANLIGSIEDILTAGPNQLGNYWNEVFHILHQSDISFDIFDPSGARADLSDYSMVLFAGYNFIDDDFERQIIEYVESGGTFVMLTAPPLFNLDGKNLTLSQMLPPIKSVSHWGGDFTLRIDHSDITVKSNWIYYFDLENHPNSTAIYGLGGVVGYSLQFGKGRFFVIGWDISKETLHLLHEACEIPIMIKTDTENVLTEVFMRGSEVAIMILNTGIDAVNATLKLDPPSLGLADEHEYHIREAFSGESYHEKGKNLRELQVSLSGKDGLIYHIK